MIFFVGRNSSQHQTRVMVWAFLLHLGKLKKETGDRRQETGGKLHGDSNPK
ncbi:MAG: hypothetical protein F6K06_27275 [Okeania sp. SIO1H4]|nr:hypothetical protein [Okeania sp. SIO1H4]NET22950.1 hypothetical protein [Okeania sp. SIO1H5]NET96384.1 hypothetical protein [Okeania sp. SIO1H2]